MSSTRANMLASNQVRMNDRLIVCALEGNKSFCLDINWFSVS